jgi:ribonuclease Z
MIPKDPPRRPQLGFLYLPPYRVQGISIAGEHTAVQIPELDLCFDIGVAPRAVLSSKFVALTHGHMDHAAGIAYYFSQRHFQGMGVGTLLCPASLEKPIHTLMRAWVDVEAQRTPYRLIAMNPGDEFEIKNHMFLRAFETLHTVPALGYVVVEKRSKLREDLVGVPQEQLVELKKKGQAITRTLEIPHVCYTGDTMRGPFFEREDVRQAKVLITECTFLEPDHQDRARVGKHLHVSDVVELLELSQAQAVVLVHLSRRTHIGHVRQFLDKAIPEKHRERVFVLMDGRNNRDRYARQVAEAQRAGLAIEEGGAEEEE